MKKYLFNFSLMLLLACCSLADENKAVNFQIDGEYKLDSVVHFQGREREFIYDTINRPWINSSETLIFKNKAVTSIRVQDNKRLVKEGFFSIKNDSLEVFTTNPIPHKAKISFLNDYTFSIQNVLKINDSLEISDYLYYSRIPTNTK